MCRWVSLLEQIGFTPENIRKSYFDDKNSISLIDPSCGSGTFLYSAVDIILKTFSDGSEESSKAIEEIVTNNIFGLDIEEFPLYLAEMNILMRMLPIIISKKYNNPVDKKIKVFKTVDSIAEFHDTAIKNTINDFNILYKKNAGQISFLNKEGNLGYSSYVRDEDDLKELKISLENRPGSERYRFDFVVGNPPYISYNECSKQGIPIFNLIKEKEEKLNDIYGVNLHSIPNKPKKYAPKPNLYAFFIALGLALLKDGSKLGYIIPQTMLTAGDLDVLRYHISNFLTIDKLIIFSGALFIKRGIKQKNVVATSSLILIASKGKADDKHEVEVINYYDKNSEISNYTKTFVRQQLLQINTSNWNFLKQNDEYLDFFQQYRTNTDDFSIYFDHKLSKHFFKSVFYFDGGCLIDSKKITSQQDKNIEVFDYKKNNNENYNISKSDTYYPTSGIIKFAQGSQGPVIFETKYKIIWRTKEPRFFQYCNRNIILKNNQSLFIGSNNEDEIKYLFGLLNSPIVKYILEKSLLQENEQAFFVPIKGIKQYVRVPEITTDNLHVKNTIINLATKLLDIESLKLSDIVDFSGVLLQKFEFVEVILDKIILTTNNQKLNLKIKDKCELVKKIIWEKYNKHIFVNIDLSDLTNLQLIDRDEQKSIKNNIDLLIFCLFFKVKISKQKVLDVEYVDELCKKNEFYHLFF